MLQLVVDANSKEVADQATEVANEKFTLYAVTFSTAVNGRAVMVHTSNNRRLGAEALGFIHWYLTGLVQGIESHSN